VCKKVSCWSMGAIYDPRELPGVSTAGSWIGRGVTHGCDKTLYWRPHRGASRCNSFKMASPGVPQLLLRGKGLRRGEIEVIGVPRRQWRSGHVARLQAQLISFTPRPNPLRSLRRGQVYVGPISWEVPSQDLKAMNDVCEECYCLFGFDASERLDLNPFGEFFNGKQQVREASGCLL
jgi:hypothetical protein